MFDIDFSQLTNILLYDSQSPMIFSSGLFLFLFLGFSLVYGLLSRLDTLRIAFVTLFSYYFYYKSSGLYFGLLAIVTISDYFIAKAIHHVRFGKKGQADDAPRKGGKWLVALSLLIDLGLLGYFKYTNFLGHIFLSSWQDLDIFLPVGVSFFTFQSLSYTIDVYRGQIRPLDRLLDYAFYVSFFPQLVAGPIVRARDFIPQIRRPLNVTRQMFGTGLFLIMAGLIKKAVISDYISLNFVDRVFDDPMLYTGGENLLAVYGYALQIFCDFSGYSDMAIGIALLLGFEFPKNFDNPYRSRSITEFWRRWHISLSSWLKDYLYISLGGNRHGKVRQYLNLLITMLLGGLWHGASFNFILWGGIHGLLLCLDKMWQAICPVLSPLKFIARKKAAKTVESELSATEDKQSATGWGFWNSIYGFLCMLITFHLVAFAWVPFRANSFEVVGKVFSQIFTNFQPHILLQWVESYTPVLCLMVLGFVFHFMPGSITRLTKRAITGSPLIIQAILLVAVIYLIIQIKSSDVQPFIYFQF